MKWLRWQNRRSILPIHPSLLIKTPRSGIAEIFNPKQPPQAFRNSPQKLIKILRHAAECAGGKLIWFPDNIKGGARTKVIESLSKRALITIDKTDWFVSEQGYRALGLPHQELIAPSALDLVKDEQATHTHKPRSRDNSKQAQVIAMLKRPEAALFTRVNPPMKDWIRSITPLMLSVTRAMLILPASEMRAGLRSRTTTTIRHTPVATWSGPRCSAY